MGKKSRLKKQRQETRLSQEFDGGMETEELQEKQTVRSEPFLLHIIRVGTYLIFLTPLILLSKAYFPFVGPKSLYFMGLCQIIFFVWLYLAIRHKEYRPKLNPILICFTLFLIVLILSSVFGIDFSRSFWSKYERVTGLLMWFHLFGFFLVISSTFKKSDWKKIFIASVSISLLISCFAILEHFGVEKLKFSDRGGSTLGNSSFLGTYILFNIFLALYLFFKEKKLLILKILYATAIILGISAIYLQEARAAIVSTIAGFGLILLLWLCFEMKSKIIKNLSRVVLVISIIIVLASIVLLYLPNNPVHQKFGELTTQSRFVNWEMARKATLERPLLGCGPENYTLIFTKFFNPCLFTSRCGGEIWFDRTHNIILDTLVTTGILGLLTYLGLFFSLFLVLWKKYFKGKLIDFWDFSIFIVLPTAYFIQNLTVFDMITSLMMFTLILGFGAFLANLGKEKEKEQRFVSRNQTMGIFLILIFLLTFSKFVIQPYRTDTFTISALADPQHRLEFYEKALETSPMGKYQIREFFAQNSENIIRRNIQEIPEEHIRLELDFAIAQLEKTNKESPTEYRSVLKLAHLYNLYVLIDPEKLGMAELYGSESIRLSPENQQGYWALAQTRIYQGRPEEALSLSIKAVELEPKLLQSHKVAIQVSKISENTELTEELIREAIKINPEWASEFEQPTPQE